MPLLLWILAAALASEPPAAGAVAALRRELSPFVEDELIVDALIDRAQRREAEVASALDTEPYLLARMAENLAQKRQAGARARQDFPLNAEEIGHSVIDYEAFKLRTHVESGVFPKRYFGYVDLKWDTAPAERTVRQAVEASVGAANAYLSEQGHAIRLTDAEVMVTFLAEGGALLLDNDAVRLDAIHPIMDIGLDSIVYGMEAHAPLARELDRRAGSHLAETIGYRADAPDEPVFLRTFDLKDAVAGTAFMLVYEMLLCEDKLREAGRPSLAGRALDEQFVLTSLHYNSGLLFSEERVHMIRELRTADYLHEVSERTAPRRPLLPVLSPREALQVYQQHQGYPDQWTSWNAVYHVLQRYGAYVALGRFTQTFDDNDMFAMAPAYLPLARDASTPDTGPAPAEGATLSSEHVERLAMVAVLGFALLGAGLWIGRE